MKQLFTFLAFITFTLSVQAQCFQKQQAAYILVKLDTFKQARIPVANYFLGQYTLLTSNGRTQKYLIGIELSNGYPNTEKVKEEIRKNLSIGDKLSEIYFIRICKSEYQDFFKN